MLIAGAELWQVVLAIHVVFVVAAFGVLVSYPLIVVIAERLDRRSVPALLRVRVILGRTVVNPGLLVVVAAGVYLASHLHLWHRFFVQWGIGAAVVIGALEGVFVIRPAGRLAGVAQREIEAAGGGEVAWSGELRTARTRAALLDALLAALVIATVCVMVVQ